MVLGATSSVNVPGGVWNTQGNGVLFLSAALAGGGVFVLFPCSKVDRQPEVSPDQKGTARSSSAGAFSACTATFGAWLREVVDARATTPTTSNKKALLIEQQHSVCQLLFFF